MANSVKLSELHGVVVSRSEHLGFDDGALSSRLTNDDEVFIKDNSLGESEKDGSIIGKLKEFPRKRKQTSKSSGYGSETLISVSEEDRSSPDTPKKDASSKRRGKEERNVFSQTDFFSDEAITEIKVEKYLPTINSFNEEPGNFCWRHDNVYEKLLFPPARPSTVNSLEAPTKGNHMTRVYTPRQKMNMSRKSCRKCQLEEAMRVDLGSRKESVRLRKDSLNPAVAEVKSSSINLLATEIENCPDLWTENRTFYIGTPRKTSASVGFRKRFLSLPDSQNETLPVKERKYFYCNNESRCTSSHHVHRSGTKHLFWIQRVSLQGELPKNGQKVTKRNKRDWILVQCVAKFVLNKHESEENYKFSYREYGEQEMILCPHELRSIEYIEDVCCQHFINMTRREAINEKRNLELLFSPKGPMVREDKHLEGRSIFYFCCDSRSKFARMKRSLSMPEQTNKDNDNLEENLDAFRKFKQSAAENSQRPLTVGGRKNKQPRSRFIAHPNRLKAASSSGGKPRPRFIAYQNRLKAASSSGRKPCHIGSTNKKDNKKSIQNANNEDLNESGLDLMKKSVAVEENNKSAKHKIETKKTLKKNVQNVTEGSKKAPLPPPPPPNFLEGDEEYVSRGRKRRESVAIAFGNANPPQPKDLSPPAVTTPASVKPYQKPKYKELKISITCKEQKFTADFSEHSTLEDLYSWIKTQLLEKNMYTPGSDLMLSCDNVNFPLKANTASTSISSLPFTTFVCLEVQSTKRGSGFGDTNSRYDTRFALPVDLRDLNNLTPVQYLSKYCNVSSTWRLFYQNIFSQHDHDRDGYISYKELKLAMEKLFVELANSLLKKVLILLGFCPNSEDRVCNQAQSKEAADSEMWKSTLSLDKQTFICICALSNRIICRESSIDGFSVSTITQSNTELEDADFYNIEGKLRECCLDPLTKRLLLYVKK